MSDERALSFIEKLRRGIPEASRKAAGERPVSFVEKLEQGKAEALAQAADPWLLRLERVRGKVGDDGVERISTQHLFDFLEVRQRSRGAGACRRLAKLMHELGWVRVKARGLTPGGFRDQVRGYARETVRPKS